MTRKNRIIIIGFGVFLVFLGICTIIAKGIYTSGIPMVVVKNPETKSIAHTIKVTGTVRQGQEYGIYTETGLRVAVVPVRTGETFGVDAPLLQIDTEDLYRIINEKELGYQKLMNQKKENETEGVYEKKEQERNLVRLQEDYENAVKEADLLINGKNQELLLAQESLKQYEQYVKNTGGTVSGGDIGTSFLQQEKMNQLKSDAVTKGQALEDAKLAKENTQLLWKRNLEDARENINTGYSALAETQRLELEYLQRQIIKLKEILASDGWIYAKENGRIIESRIAVGERTPDGACFLYAKDDGLRVVEATFSLEQTQYLAIGDSFKMETQLPSGELVREEITVEFIKTGNQGDVVAEMLLDNKEVLVGQTAQLSMIKQSEIYDSCISVNALYKNSNNMDCVNIIEEEKGFWGLEWCIRSIPVTVLDSNESFAAIQSIGLFPDTKIVINSTKELEEGSAVRVLE